MRLKFIAAVAALLCAVASAQIVTEFGGERNAIEFAYGWPGVNFPALSVATGNAATGAGQTITLVSGQTVNSGGVTLYPVTTTTPITVGIGANSETVTPTAVSNCNLPGSQTAGPVGPNCTITATFNNLHGPQEPVISGSYGLQEAINRASGSLGGAVILTGGWTRLGGTNTTIANATPVSSVYIIDNRGTGTTRWSVQPNTTTALAAPTTLTATNIVFTSATGTWAASSTHFIATCVDMLGGESPGSSDYTQTPTLNYTLTVPVPPTCSTGAVGWRLYAGTSSAAVSYLLPITSTNCTLTTLENVIAACALTSTGTWGPTFATTTALAPLGLGVVNQNNPVPQSHTTFAYQPSGLSPQIFQTQYTPFGTGTVATATAAQVTMLGTAQLPTGFFNTIARTVRLTGKIQAGATAGGTLELITALHWVGGDTAGLPVTVCDTVGFAVLGTQNYTIPFSCTLTTNATGATAIGSLQPDSFLIAGGTAGTTNVVATDANLTAVTSLGLFAQNSLNIYVKPATHDLTAVRLMDLHVEVLQ